MSQRKPIPEDIGEYVRLDPETGKLWWIKKPSDRIAVGTEAFATKTSSSSARSGYYYGMFRKQNYLAHRVVWFLYHGAQPPDNIDHIDVDGCNNRPSNLRETCRSLNLCNRAAPRNNTSGIKGVSWHRDARKWEAKVGFKGTYYRAGYFDDIAEAEIAVRQLREQLHGDFTNHG